MFALASLIDSSEYNRIQNFIQDNIQGEKPNSVNLKNQWDKTRAYVGVSPKYGVIRRILISSLTTPRRIRTDTLVLTFVILNGPNLSPSDLW